MIKTNASQTNIESLYRMSSVVFLFYFMLLQSDGFSLEIDLPNGPDFSHFSLADGGITYPEGCYEDEPEKVQVKCYVLCTW